MANKGVQSTLVSWCSLNKSLQSEWDSPWVYSERKPRLTAFGPFKRAKGQPTEFQVIDGPDCGGPRNNISYL